MENGFKKSDLSSRKILLGKALGIRFTPMQIAWLNSFGKDRHKVVRAALDQYIGIYHASCGSPEQLNRDLQKTA